MFYEEAACMLRHPLSEKNPRRETLERPDTQRRLCTDTAEFAGVKMENVCDTASPATSKETRQTGGKKSDTATGIESRHLPGIFRHLLSATKLYSIKAKNQDMTDMENFDFTPAWDF